MTFNVQVLIDALGIGYYILVYGVGIVALTLSVIAFQFKRRITIILSSLIGQICWTAHFVLQGDLTSAIACILSAIMLFVFSKSDKHKWTIHPITVAFFIAVLTGFSLLTFKTWTDIFPIIAGIFAALTNSRATEKSLRKLSVPWCFAWLLNSLFKMYPVALINDCFCSVSAIVGLIRFRKLDNQKNDYKLAIFDMDGTLVDSLYFWDIFWEKFGEKYLSNKNFTVPPEVETAVRANMFDDSMRLVRELYAPEVSEEELIRFGNDLVIWFYSEKVEVKDGVIEFLEYLKANDIKMCIASASAADKIEIALQRCGLAGYFDKVFSCADTGIGKEEPDVFLRAAKHYGIEPSDTCVFEDSLVPATTVKKAGFRTVGVCDKHNNFSQDKLRRAVDIYLSEKQTLASLIK